MKRRNAFVVGALGFLAAVAMPLKAHAQGMALRQGVNYAIGFPDSVALGSGLAKGVGTYRVTGAAGDQQWYRVRLVVRNPQGGWIIPPGATDVWINLSYAMWVQEVKL